MSTIVVREERPGEWEVWIGLGDGDPTADGIGFIIGLGATRDAAVAAAVHDLEAAVDRLQCPLGTRCESCGRYVDPDPDTPEGRGHRVTNSDGSPGYCGPVTLPSNAQETTP